MPSLNDVYINIQWYQNWRTLHPTVHCSAVFAALVVQLPVEVRLGAEIILVEGLNATCRYLHSDELAARQHQHPASSMMVR